VYRGRLILYGCGDFINDDEGIGGHEEFRADLGLMYVPILAASSGTLRKLAMPATGVCRFRVGRAHPDNANWIQATLGCESRRFGTCIQLSNDGGRRAAG